MSAVVPDTDLHTRHRYQTVHNPDSANAIPPATQAHLSKTLQDLLHRLQCCHVKVLLAAVKTSENAILDISPGSTGTPSIPT